MLVSARIFAAFWQASAIERFRHRPAGLLSWNALIEPLTAIVNEHGRGHRCATERLRRMIGIPGRTGVGPEESLAESQRTANARLITAFRLPAFGADGDPTLVIPLQ